MSLSRCGLRVRGVLLVTCAALLTTGHAAPSGDVRAAPISLAEGGLSISAPSGPVALGSGAPGSTFSAELGAVTVTAASGVSSWTASVTLTSRFRVTQGDQSWMLPNDRVEYLAGAALPGGLGVDLCTPGHLTPQTLAQPRTAFSCAGILSLTSTSLSWSPTLRVRTQPDDPAGTYTGTITHSVA